MGFRVGSQWGYDMKDGSDKALQPGSSAWSAHRDSKETFVSASQTEASPEDAPRRHPSTEAGRGYSEWRRRRERSGAFQSSPVAKYGDRGRDKSGCHTKLGHLFSLLLLSS